MPLQLVGWGFNGFGQLSSPPFQVTATEIAQAGKLNGDNTGDEDPELARTDVPITSPRILDTASHELSVLWVGWSEIVYVNDGRLSFLGYKARERSKIWFPPDVRAVFGDHEGMRGVLTERGEVWWFFQDDEEEQEGDDDNWEHEEEYGNSESESDSDSSGRKRVSWSQGRNPKRRRADTNPTPPTKHPTPHLRLLDSPNLHNTTHLTLATNGTCVSIQSSPPNSSSSSSSTTTTLHHFPLLPPTVPSLSNPLPAPALSLASTHTTFTLLLSSSQLHTLGDPRHSLARTPTALHPAASPSLVTALDGIPISTIAAGGWVGAAVAEEGGDLYLWGGGEEGEEEVGLVEGVEGVESVAVGDDGEVGVVKGGEVLWRAGKVSDSKDEEEGEEDNEKMGKEREWRKVEIGGSARELRAGGGCWTVVVEVVGEGANGGEETTGRI